jgi:triacylglycerol lipase
MRSGGGRWPRCAVSVPKLLPADTWQNLFYPPPDYKYFENADGFPFEPDAPGFSWKNAWWLADAAVLAYVKDWSAVKAALNAAGFDDVRPIGPDAAKSTKGFFASRSGSAPFALVSFRGTDKDDPRSAASDADIGPADRDGYTVHRGFALALDQVWDSEVRGMLAGFAGPVYFTGHSLGAALAAIAVTRFSGGRCGLYTIGSPRVGDDRFTSAVHLKTEVVFRFVNSQDIVTLIPPEVPFRHYFRHVGLEKYIDRHGKIHDHPSEIEKSADVVPAIIAHDGTAALQAIGHPGEFRKRVMLTGPYVDPPPYIVGNHSPARYPTRIWNYYSGM